MHSRLEDLSEVLGHVDFKHLVKLEKLRLGIREKVVIRKEDGWEISLSRKTSSGEVLQNEIFVRKANYEFGIVELFRIYYCVLDIYIQLQTYPDFSVRYRSLSFVKLSGRKLLLDGTQAIHFPEKHIPYLVSSLRNRTYLPYGNFLFTPIKITYRNITIDRVLFYLFLEK